MRDGLLPLPVQPCNFAQPEFRGGIHWVNRELLFELLLGISGTRRGFRLGKSCAAQTVVDATQLRVFLQDVSIDGCGFGPLLLRFKTLSLQLAGLIRVGSNGGKLLRSAFRDSKKEL